MRKKALTKELTKIEGQVEQLLDRLAGTDMPSVISANEKRIRDLETRKAVSADNTAHCGQPQRGFDEALETAFSFLENPWKLWAQGVSRTSGQC